MKSGWNSFTSAIGSWFGGSDRGSESLGGSSDDISNKSVSSAVSGGASAEAGGGAIVYDPEETFYRRTGHAHPVDLELDNFRTQDQQIKDAQGKIAYGIKEMGHAAPPVLVGTGGVLAVGGLLKSMVGVMTRSSRSGLKPLSRQVGALNPKGNGSSVTKKVTNSAGNQVNRKLVKNQDELLGETERAAGGSLDKFKNYKPDWWKSPDGKRKVEWNPNGHANVNEGPHVTVRDFDGKRHSVTEKIFIEGQEKFK